MPRKKEREDQPSNKPRSATDLLNDPLIVEDPDPEPIIISDTPFDKAYTVLTATSGEVLELMTRTTPKLATAVGVGYTMRYNFKSNYIGGRMDNLMRIHVSFGGRGRNEMVQSLKAGSGVPDSYYARDGGGSRGYGPVGGDE